MKLSKVSKTMERKSKTVRETLKQLDKECSNFLPNKDRDLIKIMENVLEINETGVLSNLDKLLSDSQYKKVNKIIKRIQNNEPLEYITETGFFYGNKYRVTRDTLIPRPETEILIDLSLSELSFKVYDPDKKQKELLNIADVGTGTGCIAVSMALSLKRNTQIYATDKSKSALQVAKENIKNSRRDNIIIPIESDIFLQVPKDLRFDLIVANLPYISSKKIDGLPKSVKDYEPKEALDGGIDGIEIVKRLLEQSKSRLRDDGVIILELDPTQIQNVEKIAKKLFPNSTLIRSKDLSQTERFLTIRT